MTTPVGCCQLYTIFVALSTCPHFICKQSGEACKTASPLIVFSDFRDKLCRSAIGLQTNEQNEQKCIYSARSAKYCSAVLRKMQTRMPRATGNGVSANKNAASAANSRHTALPMKICRLPSSFGRSRR